MVGGRLANCPSYIYDTILRRKTFSLLEARASFFVVNYRHNVACEAELRLLTPGRQNKLFRQCKQNALSPLTCFTEQRESQVSTVDSFHFYAFLFRNESDSTFNGSLKSGAQNLSSIKRARPNGFLEALSSKNNYFF